MLTSSPPKTISLEEYRNLETIAEVKHEYHDGEIIEMTGVSINHNSILINLIVLLKLAPLVMIGVINFVIIVLYPN